MRGTILHTVVTIGRRADWGTEDVPFRSKKSSPGYEAYFPKYKLLERRQGTLPGGAGFTASIKAFMSEHLIIEARTDFDGDDCKGPLSIKDALNDEAIAIAKEYSEFRLSEEYTFYLVSEYESLDIFITQNRLMIAQLLKDDASELADEEIGQTLASSLRYDKNDMTVIEWDGALLMDKNNEFEDNITLIELANIQLLSLRALDDALAGEIGLFKGFEAIRTPNIFRLSGFLKSIINVRARSLLNLDEIDNSIKLYGDWYSAKVYSIVAKKLYLAKWRDTVEEKLNLLEKMFEMVSQRQGEIYNITLEISIVFLILLEIVLLVLGVA